LLGQLILGLSLSWVMWYGNIYLEYCPGGNYTCPHYCIVNHIHYTEDCNENKIQQEAYKQRNTNDAGRDSVRTDDDTIAAKHINQDIF